MELKKNSWHYYVASEIGGFNDKIDGFYYSTDDQGNTNLNIPICPYIRSVLLGIILFLFVTFICGIALYSMGYALGWIGMSLYNDLFTTPNSIFIIVGIAIIIIIIFYFICRIRWKILTRKYQVEKESSTSFISAAYKSFKDKFCFYITLK